MLKVKNLKASIGEVEILKEIDLEILCDDVICGHGSSVGPIDEDLYHYVMSRGINKEDAEKLLIKGFFNEVINEDPWEIIHDEVAEILSQKYENIL